MGTSLKSCVEKVSKCKMGNFASFLAPSLIQKKASSNEPMLDGVCGWHKSCAGWPDSIANTSSAYVSARAHPVNYSCSPWINGGTCSPTNKEDASTMLAV